MPGAPDSMKTYTQEFGTYSFHVAGALSLLALVGTITFLIVKGRRTPTMDIDPSPEKATGIQDEIDEE